jgi:hypothetical protein
MRATAKQWLRASAAALIFGMAPALAQAAAPTLRFEPDEVAPGEATTLVVEREGAAGRPELPHVSGLSIAPVGQRSQFTQINGQSAQTTSYLYSVVAARPGDFTLAGVRVGGDAAAPVTLHVDAHAAQHPAQAGAASARAPGASQRADAEAGPRAFLRLRIDKHALYAGESVPFTAQAFVRAGTGATLTGAPALTSDAFVVSGLDDKPAQRETTIGGEPYLAVTWRGVLTAAKPGAHALELALPLTLQYRDVQPTAAAPRGASLRDLLAANPAFGAMMQDPFFASMLDRSMLDDAMFDGMLEPGRMVTRDVVLRDGAGDVQVRALPGAGRPDDFSGAVGEFEIESSLARTDLNQGEPVDLQMVVRGSGNFGHFTPAGLRDTPAFQAYAAHSEFNAADKSGTRGELRLVQPVAAQQTGPQQLPALRFSYFDPNKGRYVEKQSAPIAVQVAPAAPQARGVQPATSAARDESARGDALSVASLTRGGVPSWLWPLCCAILLSGALAAAGVGFARSDAYRTLLARGCQSRGVRAQRTRLREAAQRGDVPAFARSARAAIQQRLGAAFHMRPEAVTQAELERRWPDPPAPLRELLDLADRADYGQGAAALADADAARLSDWARDLEHALSQVEERKS